MKKSILLALTLLIGAGITNADDRYTYLVDLTRVENDELMVTLLPPEINQTEVTFYLPKIIPGTYREANYGKYVRDLAAYDKKGKALAVRRLGDNSWRISKANKLAKVTYWVEDTYDSEIDNTIYPMAGTNIEEGENFILSTPGFFGYFEGQKDLPFEIKIVRPKDFYGGTGLIPVMNPEMSSKIEKELEYVQEDTEIDHFVTDDYNHLVDSPIMYCQPDTTIIEVAGTEVLIAVYSPGDNVQSQYLSENLRELLYAQRDYLGGELPVDKYAFILYFESGKHSPSGYGALEHSYSSLYYLPDFDQTAIIQPIRDVAAHEFFHIITPLNIHSEEIENFDYNDPKMSQHLWLYEGMTEYAAGHAQAKHGIISLQEYLDKLSQKISLASNNFDDKLSFTDLSQYTLEKYPDQYQNVYYKGALIGLCLDVMLRDLSDGAYGTQDLMADLAKSYGKERAFKDEELFDKIGELTYPEIRTFLDHYVKVGDVLPYETVFGTVGISYNAKVEEEIYSLGQIGIGIDDESGRLVVDDNSQMNKFGKSLGYKMGDQLLQINGTDLPEIGGVQQFLDDVRENMVEGDTLTVTVNRKNKDEEWEEVTLSSPIFKVKVNDEHVLAPIAEPTERQQMIFKAWLTPSE